MQIPGRRPAVLCLALWVAAAHCLARDFTFFEPVEPPRPFQTMALRGEAGQAPGNSRAALWRCIEDGIEWAEVDVRLTRDGQHVVVPGDTLTGFSNAVWRVDEHTLKELQSLDIGSTFAARYRGERLLSLKEALELAKGKLNLRLDCKDTDPALLVRDILAAGMEHQVAVYDDLDHLRRIRAAAADRLAIMARWHPDLGTTDWTVRNGVDAVEIDALKVTPNTCEAFHHQGIKVVARTRDQWDRPEIWSKAAAAGADWVQTGHPEELMAQSLWQRVRTRPVRFSLHRGANRYAPENTLPAFEKAIRLGADFIEFDVRTTRDGQFYLLHDRVLEGKTDGKGKIAELPSSVISTFSAGVKFGREYAKVPLPTLEEFLDDVAGRVDLYFDAKDIAPKPLSDALERHRVVDHTVVYGEQAFLEQVKAVNPRIRLLAPLRSPGALATLARDLKPYAVDADWDILAPELIARCHALGIKVFSDALGSHERIEEYQKAMDWGIDLIQTDHPLRLFRAIERRASPRIK